MFHFQFHSWTPLETRVYLYQIVLYMMGFDSHMMGDFAACTPAANWIRQWRMQRVYRRAEIEMIAAKLRPLLQEIAEVHRDLITPAW